MKLAALMLRFSVLTFFLFMQEGMCLPMAGSIKRSLRAKCFIFRINNYNKFTEEKKDPCGWMARDANYRICDMTSFGTERSDRSEQLRPLQPSPISTILAHLFLRPSRSAGHLLLVASSMERGPGDIQRIVSCRRLPMRLFFILLLHTDQGSDTNSAAEKI